MNQLDLLSGISFVPWRPHELARSSDPQTSKILAALVYGAAGVDRIASTAGLTVAQVSKRIAECERAGLIRQTGKTVQSASGRSQREWCLTR